MKDWLDCAPAFHSGTEMQAYRCLGVKRQGDAYLARIYAPTALRAFVVGEFNAWGESHPMTHPEGDETVFETRISPAEWERGRLYKFKLVTRAGECYVADPFAPRTECAPERASFYDTLDNLEQKLDSDFVRCHRSFIIAKSRIKKVMLSKNLILLDNGYEIPLSRSYKSAIKELTCK